MWIDQLSIPQNRDETMPIVHASGSFYRQFEVFVWVPWALRSDDELLERMQTANSEDANGTHAMTNEIAAGVSELYLQFKRGWILRESNVTCFPSQIERNRNLQYLRWAKQVLSRKIKDKREYYANNEGVSALTIGSDGDFNKWVKANGEVDHVWQVIQTMEGKEMDLCARVISAARITIAPFTVEVDREIVAGMDGLKKVCDMRGENADKRNPFYCYLKMVLFIGCLAFREKKYSEFPDFVYSTSDCKRFLSWLFRTCEKYVSYSETLWYMFLNRLQTGHFTAFLPPDYPLKDIAKYAPFTNTAGDEENDELVAIVVSRWGVVIQKVNKAQKDVIYFDEIDNPESVSKLLDVVSNPKGYADIYVCWRLPPGEKAEDELKDDEDCSTTVQPVSVEAVSIVEIGHSDQHVCSTTTETIAGVTSQIGETNGLLITKGEEAVMDGVVVATTTMSTKPGKVKEGREKCCRLCCC